MSKEFLESALENSNIKAFLHTIRTTEGTTANDGYNYIFGSSPHNDHRFSDFSKHPNIAVPYANSHSTAAGAYQILYPTWLEIKSKLCLQDFTPHSQDIACAYLLSERNCLQKIMDGEFEYAIGKCNTIWASLPNSPYGQPTHTMDEAKEAYEEAGGICS